MYEGAGENGTVDKTYDGRADHSLSVLVVHPGIPLLAISRRLFALFLVAAWTTPELKAHANAFALVVQREERGFAGISDQRRLCSNHKIQGRVHVGLEDVEVD